MAILSAEERTNLLADWGSAVPDDAAKRKYGEAFLTKLFQQFPSYIEMFNNFKGKPLSQLVNEQTFKDHAFRIMSALCKIIESLNDEGAATKLIDELAVAHVARKTNTQNFKNAFGIVQCIMSPLLHSEHSKVALQKVFEKAAPIMETHLH